MIIEAKALRRRGAKLFLFLRGVIKQGGSANIQVEEGCEKLRERKWKIDNSERRVD